MSGVKKFSTSEKNAARNGRKNDKNDGAIGMSDEKDGETETGGDGVSAKLQNLTFGSLIGVVNFFILLVMAVSFAISTKPSDVFREVQSQASVLDARVENNATAIKAAMEANKRSLDANNDLVAAQRDLLKEFSKIQSALIMLVQQTNHANRQLREELEEVARKNGLELPESLK